MLQYFLMAPLVLLIVLYAQSRISVRRIRRNQRGIRNNMILAHRSTNQIKDGITVKD